MATLDGKPMAGLAKSSMTKLHKIPTDEAPEPPSAVAIFSIQWYAARRRGQLVYEDEDSLGRPVPGLCHWQEAVHGNF